MTLTKERNNYLKFYNLLLAIAWLLLTVPGTRRKGSSSMPVAV